MTHLWQTPPFSWIQSRDKSKTYNRVIHFRCVYLSYPLSPNRILNYNRYLTLHSSLFGLVPVTIVSELFSVFIEVTPRIRILWGWGLQWRTAAQRVISIVQAERQIYCYWTWLTKAGSRPLSAFRATIFAALTINIAIVPTFCQLESQRRRHKPTVLQASRLRRRFSECWYA